MGTRYKERAKLLWLRKQVTLGEAPYLVIDKLGGMYDDAFALLFEAIKDKSLPADVKPVDSWEILDEYEIADAIASLQITLATSDLVEWLEPLINHISATDGPPPPNCTEPQTAPGSQTDQSGNDWKDRVRAIADELDSRDEKSGAWSSKEDMSNRVAAIAIEREIRGPYGQLTAGNILREALQGSRWERRNKNK